MANPVSRFATRVAYGASQLPRVAWYVGHSVVMRRLSEEVRRGAGESTRRQASTDAPVPDRGRLYADMATLFLQDLANVEVRPMMEGRAMTLLIAPKPAVMQKVSQMKAAAEKARQQALKEGRTLPPDEPEEEPDLDDDDDDDDDEGDDEAEEAAQT